MTYWFHLNEIVLFIVSTMHNPMNLLFSGITLLSARSSEHLVMLQNLREKPQNEYFIFCRYYPLVYGLTILILVATFHCFGDML